MHICSVQRAQDEMAARLSSEELQVITNSIVSSPQFQQSVERALSGTFQSNSVRNAETQPVQHTTPEEEMRSLFNRSRSVTRPPASSSRNGAVARPRFSTDRNRRFASSGSAPRNRSAGPSSRPERPPYVLKEVVLLVNPNERNVVRGPRKTMLMEEGEIFCFPVNYHSRQGRRSVGRARGASRKVRALVSEGEPKNGGSGCIPVKFFGATPFRLA